MDSNISSTASNMAPAFAESLFNGLRSLSSKLGQQSNLTLVGIGLATLAILFNTKNLPFAYHIRIFYSLYTHRRPLPIQERAGALFLPVVNRTGTPATDCDYNAHKSNSTFFSDLDLSRIHLLGRLGLLSLSDHVPRPMLGGAACAFLRPVAPFQRVAIYTRVLSWDDKWIYLASAIVPEASSPKKEPPVLATSVARYVFKKGRKTIAPAEVLQTAQLLPGPVDAAVPRARHADGDPTQRWSWEVAEQERLRGLETARCMGSLEALTQDVRREATLGEY